MLMDDAMKLWNMDGTPNPKNVFSTIPKMVFLFQAETCTCTMLEC